MKTDLLAPHERRLSEGCGAAQRAIFRADAGVLPMREFELRSKPDGTGGEKLNFLGYASVTEVGYTIPDWLGDYQEIVRSGAFTRTLSQDPDVMFLLNHGGMTMARTRSGSLRLSEDDKGLNADADLNPKRNDVHDLRVAIEDEDISEMSFAFRVVQQQWSPDYTQRDILEVDINGGDVSTVNKGANPGTGGLVSLRAMVSPRLLHSVTTTLRAGDQLTPQQSATLTRVLSALAMADDHIDASLEDLSDFLGVPNPDTDAAPDTNDVQMNSAADLEEVRALMAADLYEIDRRFTA